MSFVSFKYNTYFIPRYLYSYFPSRESAKDPPTVKMIAEMTAKMHKMPLAASTTSSTKGESRLWSYMRLLLGLCPDGPDAFAEAKRASGKEVPAMEVLTRYGMFEL